MYMLGLWKCAYCTWDNDEFAVYTHDVANMTCSVTEALQMLCWGDAG